MLIPILALSFPVIALASHCIIKPLVQEGTPLTEPRLVGASPQRQN